VQDCDDPVCDNNEQNEHACFCHSLIIFLLNGSILSCGYDSLGVATKQHLRLSLLRAVPDARWWTRIERCQGQSPPTWRETGISTSVLSKVAPKHIGISAATVSVARALPTCPTERSGRCEPPKRNHCPPGWTGGQESYLSPLSGLSAQHRFLPMSARVSSFTIHVGQPVATRWPPEFLKHSDEIVGHKTDSMFRRNASSQRVTCARHYDAHRSSCRRLRKRGGHADQNVITGSRAAGTRDVYVSDDSSLSGTMAGTALPSHSLPGA
jgi:hypothetical protein